MNSTDTATFGTGCFWCTEAIFKELEGVISVMPGYSGGHTVNPTYKEVCEGRTGHLECLQVIFDPKKISYDKLLDVYWKSIDPTRTDGQFCDIGSQYRPVIFYTTESQKKIAEHSKERLIKEDKIKPILVEILPAKTFYVAEEYHQEYYKKNPTRYNIYRSNSGRDKKF